MKRKQTKTEYKIRHTVTGRYSAGGQWPHWSATGKTWTELRFLNAHLSGALSVNPAGTGYLYGNTPVEALEIVPVEIVASEGETRSMLDHVEEFVDRQHRRNAARRLPRLPRRIDG